jgi:hypothetical protein
MILDFFKFGFSFGSVLIILGIFLILFLIGREIFLWYFRVNYFISLMEETSSSLDKISKSLEKLTTNNKENK